MGNKDKTRDGNATANRDHSRDQESRDAALARTITEAVALQTQSILQNRPERQQRRPSLWPKHLQGKWKRLIRNIRTY